MGELAFGKTPACLEVFGEGLGLLDGGDESVVDRLLVSGLGLGEGLLGLGLAILKELLLSRRSGLGRRLGEVGIIKLVVDLISYDLENIHATNCDSSHLEARNIKFR